ncbi:hypothetical protein FDP22_11565 [Paroceanicella profunda]|uniref:Transporter n=1 Tax=Paroceanicella profunda TaxID=2579971 RepID=A0A5B8FUC4_9RHOB|nr:hypothetical protein [Paroceanicella profunda]QDL92356.1 hypothetical protein FDP22_11565 [Paroceanicella profunda]
MLRPATIAILRLGCAALLAAGPFWAAGARAGAWPRGEGAAFLSLSTLLSTPAREFPLPRTEFGNRVELYGEYGLTADWTLGFDLADAPGDFGETTGIAFARRTVWQGARDVFALEFGLGMRHDEDSGTSARLRPGASWGRGFETGWGGGWMGLESSVEFTPPEDTLILKLDATIGLRPTENWALFAQLQNTRITDSGTYIKIEPSAAYRLSESSRIVLGVNIGLYGDTDLGVKLSSWLEF